MRFLLIPIALLTACSTAKEEKPIVLLPIANQYTSPYTGSVIPLLSNFPAYIGKYRDTVDIRNAFKFEPDTIYDIDGIGFQLMLPKLKGAEDHIAGYDNCPRPSLMSSSFTIQIDTSNLSYANNVIYVSSPNDSRRQVYPLILHYNDKDTFFFYDLRIQIEAKKSPGNWQIIANHKSKVDHVGEPFYFIAPEELLVTYVPRFGGSEPTAFRVKFLCADREYYSEVYHDSINPKLFQPQ